MIDKVQKIHEEVERLKSNLVYGACSSQVAMETRCKEEAYNEVLAILDTMQEEPVSENLEVELNKYIKDHFTIDTEQLDRFGIEEKDYMYSMDKGDMLALVEHFTNWQKTKEEPVSEELEEASKEWLSPQLDKSYANYGEAKMMELTHFDGYAMLDAIEFGAQWQKENIWKPADGDDLPEIGREVVAFQADFPNLFKIVVAHRPNPEGYDGKSLSTGKVEHYTSKTYGEGGWNIPDIVYWLDVELPKEIEL